MSSIAWAYPAFGPREVGTAALDGVRAGEPDLCCDETGGADHCTGTRSNCANETPPDGWNGKKCSSAGATCKYASPGAVADGECEEDWEPGDGECHYVSDSFCSHFQQGTCSTLWITISGSVSYGFESIEVTVGASGQWAICQCTNSSATSEESKTRKTCTSNNGDWCWY
jgi:hypothetical protein